MINIAIDGPSGAGKSTISDVLAQKLSYVHLDTGAMYRSLGLKCLESKVAFDDEEAIVQVLNAMELDMKADGRVILDGEDVTERIRANNISMAASQVSRHAKVRAGMVAKQQEICKNKGFIVDGRDIGTVVLKDAEVKLYLTASAESRADRRVKQYAEKGIVSDYNEILEDINKRDYSDIHRAASPLRKADDAIEVDSSNMSKEEVIATCLDIISKKLG